MEQSPRRFSMVTSRMYSPPCLTAPALWMSLAAKGRSDRARIGLPSQRRKMLTCSFLPMSSPWHGIVHARGGRNQARPAAQSPKMPLVPRACPAPDRLCPRPLWRAVEPPSQVRYSGSRALSLGHISPFRHVGTMQTDELLKLAKKEKLQELESAWTGAVEQDGVA